MESSDNCGVYLLVTNIIIGILCLMGLVCNAVAFVAFCKDSKKTSTSFLFQGLCVIDSIFLLLLIPLYIPNCIEHISSSAFEAYLNNIQPFILVYLYPFVMMAQTSTVWIVVLVAVDRYIAVCKPYKASVLCTIQQARKRFILVVLAAIIYNVPLFFESRIVPSSKNNTVNGSDYGYTFSKTAFGANKVYSILYQTVGYYVFLSFGPLLILAVLNIILIVAWKGIRQKRKTQSRREQNDNKVTAVLIVVVLVFFLCQVPTCVIRLLELFEPGSSQKCDSFPFFFRPIADILLITNSAVNFFIYYVLHPRFLGLLKCTVQKGNATTLQRRTELPSLDTHGV